MTKRREARPVTLTDDQRRRLERAWFYFGNYGPKTTPGNHQFIQGLLEHGVDMRPLFTKRTPKSEKPTLECEATVDKVLAAGAEEGTPGEIHALHLVPPPPGARPRPAPDPELKALLEDIRRRSTPDGKIGLESDTPDAA